MDEEGTPEVGPEPAPEVTTVPLDEVESMESEPQPLDPALIDEDVVRALMHEVETLRARAEDAEKAVVYKAAEVANVRKRAGVEQAVTRRWASQGVIRRMLGILDDLDRALSVAEPDGESTAAVLDGVRMVRARLWDELSAEGVTAIISAGARFDPQLHEAVMMVPPSEATPAGHIVSVLEMGYRLHERVLRAARVVVASEATDAET